MSDDTLHPLPLFASNSHESFVHMKPILTESSADGHCVEEREPK